MPSATGAAVTSADIRRAWKFLAPGAVSPFAGLSWPLPSGGEPGTWVSSPSRGIFACRLRDLPWWIDAELWEVELADPVEMLDTQLRASAARLVSRTLAWDPAACRAYGAACALRVRDWAVEALESEQRSGDAASLRNLQLLSDVVARARPLDGKGRAASLAGFSADAAFRANLGNAGAAANIAANAAIRYHGSPEAFHAERTWQAGWIAQRAGLTPEESA